MTDDIIWEDPPDDGRGNRRYFALWVELKANPGRWARLPHSKGSITVLRASHPDFEIITRDGTLFGRYIGEDGES